jgi:hypothetical protein
VKLLKNILLLIFLSFSLLAVKAENPYSVVSKASDIEIVKLLNEAEVYPNPAEDYIYVKISDQSISAKMKIEVMSIIGTKMKISHEKIDAGLYKISLKDIPTGHYYVMLTIDSDKSLKKFIKK